MLPGPYLIHACPGCGALHRRGTLSSGNSLGASTWSDGKEEAPDFPETPRLTKCHGCSRVFWLEDATQVGQVPYHYKPGVAEPDRYDITLVSIGPDRELLLKVLAYHGFRIGPALEKALSELPVELMRNVGDAGPFAAMLKEAGAAVDVVVRPAPTYPIEWCHAPEVDRPEGPCFQEALRAGLARTPMEEIYLRQRVWWADNDAFRRGARWLPVARRPPEVRQNVERLFELLAGRDWLSHLLQRAELARQLGRFDEAAALIPPIPRTADDDETWPLWAQVIGERAYLHDAALICLPRSDAWSKRAAHAERVTPVDPRLPRTFTGGSRPEPCACLVLTDAGARDMGAGARIDLLRSPSTAGRTSECDIVLDNPSVARRHCRFEVHGPVWWIADLESPSGIYVNDRHTSQQQLHDGDLVRFGGVSVRFLCRRDFPAG